MTERIPKVALACFFGGVLGFIVASYLGAYLWPVGAIIGGALAYLAYDPLQAVAASKRAWCEVTDTARFARFGAMALKPAVVAVSFVVGIATVFATFISAIWVADSLVGPEIITSVLFYGALSIFVGGYMSVLSSERLGFDLAKHSEWGVAILFNPISVIVGAVSIPFVGAFLVFLALRKGVPCALSFIWRVFCYIHDDYRLICFADGTIGVAVSVFLLQPTLAGALASGAVAAILGVLNTAYITPFVRRRFAPVFARND